MKLLKLFLVILVGIVFSTIVVNFFEVITIAGRHIPQDDLVQDYGTAIIWACALFVLLLVLPFKNTERPAILWIWFIKCVVTLGVMLFYEYRYGLDSYRYYFASLGDHAPIFIPYISIGTRFLEWLSWQMNTYLPIFGSYHAMKVIYAFIGLFGVILFYKSWVKYFGKENIRWMYLIGLFPTILFWSSILGKEPIVFCGIGLYAYGTVSLLKSGNYRHLGSIFVGVAIASLVRFWLSVILVAPIGFVFLFRPQTGIVKKGLVLALYAFSFMYFSQEFLDKFQIESQDQLVERSNSISRSWSIGGSKQEVPEFNSFKDIVLFSPKGIFTALFRPLPGEVNNVFGLVAGMENLIFLAFLIISAVNRTRFVNRGPVFVWGVSLVLIWAFVYGLVSFQNLGTAVRFKLQIIPILLMVTIALKWTWDEQKTPELSEPNEK